jgi:hypothetical protein
MSDLVTMYMAEPGRGSCDQSIAIFRVAGPQVRYEYPRRNTLSRVSSMGISPDNVNECPQVSYVLQLSL